MNKNTLLLISLLFLSLVSHGQHFSTVWSGNPYLPMNVIILEATINNIEMEVGDEIAVYDVGTDGELICVGYSILTQSISSGAPLIIIASSDDPTTESIIDGFTEGHEIQFHLWDSSESEEVVFVQANYNELFASQYQPLETAVCDINTCAIGDFDCDCDIDIIDVTMAAYHYGASAGDANYDPKFDLDGDGDIDIVDITIIAYNYGWTCDSKSLVQYPLFNIDNSKVNISIEESNSGNDFLYYDVKINEVNQLGGFELELDYNAIDIEVVEIQDGGFVGSTGRECVEISKVFDNETGKLIYSVTTLGSQIKGASGSGNLFRVKCKISANHHTSPIISSGQLVRIDAEVIPYNLLTTSIEEKIELQSNKIISVFPNPFKNKTTIRYSLEQESNITFEIYDVLGNYISTIFKGQQKSGIFDLEISQQNLSSGIYMLIFKSENEVVELKKIVIKH